MAGLFLMFIMSIVLGEMLDGYMKELNRREG
jgi:hypothetical protein